jgi:hypothetical protein
MVEETNKSLTNPRDYGGLTPICSANDQDHEAFYTLNGKLKYILEVHLLKDFFFYKA